MKLIWITDAKYLNGYKMMLTFNDGVKKTFDFATLSGSKEKLFGTIKDLNVFRNFKLDGWTLTWNNGATDIAPEFLYEQGEACTV